MLTRERGAGVLPFSRGVFIIGSDSNDDNGSHDDIHDDRDDDSDGYGRGNEYDYVERM
jgi:hypothetical protein